MAGILNLNSGCRGNAGLDGRIKILFSRHDYSSPQGRLSYNNKPLTGPYFSLKNIFRLLFLGHTAHYLFSIAALLFCRKNRGENKSTIIHTAIDKGQNS